MCCAEYKYKYKYKYLLTLLRPQGEQLDKTRKGLKTCKQHNKPTKWREGTSPLAVTGWNLVMIQGVINKIAIFLNVRRFCTQWVWHFLGTWWRNITSTDKLYYLLLCFAFAFVRFVFYVWLPSVVEIKLTLKHYKRLIQNWCSLTAICAIANCISA